LASTAMDPDGVHGPGSLSPGRGTHIRRRRPPGPV